MDNKTSSWQRWQDYRASKTALFWSCAACAVATIVVGFGWGGWMTGGSAAAMAKEAATDARAELAAAVCVDRFQAAGDAGAQIVALKTLEGDWKRATFVEQGGWAVMPDPGAAKSASQVARLCAARLALLEAPPTVPPTAATATVR